MLEALLVHIVAAGLAENYLVLQSGPAHLASLCQAMQGAISVRHTAMRLVEDVMDMLEKHPARKGPGPERL